MTRNVPAWYHVGMKKHEEKSGVFEKTVSKVCKACGEVKIHKWTSSFTCTGKPQYRPRCQDCQNAVFRRKRKEAGKWEAYKAYKRKCTTAKKAWAVALLGGKCCICGYEKTQRALTFHHKDRSDKGDSIARMVQDQSKETIKKELAKCILVCFNCHMEIEEEYDRVQRGRFSGPDQGLG